MPTAHATPFSSIPPKTLHWLWPSRIPLGKISLLAGDPASGKTSLALHLAAQLSRALPIVPSPPATNLASTQIGNRQSEIGNPPRPNLTNFTNTPIEPRATLLLSPEDNAADTLRPRLDALHADPNLIFTAPDLLSLLPSPDHNPLAYLEDLILSIPNLALLIIDPITHFLGLTDHRLLNPAPHSPRSTLHALAALAQKHNFALLLTSRLTKKLPPASDTPTLPSLHRLLGPLAFTSPRTTHLLLPFAPVVAPGLETRNPTLETPPPNRLLLTLKSPLPTLPPALPFTLSDILTFHPPIPLPTLFPPPTPKPPSPRVIKDTSALAEALHFLRITLADGPIKATVVHSRAAALHISTGTLRRAFDELKAVSRYAPLEPAWYWSLPDDPRPIPTILEQLARALEMESLRILPPPAKTSVTTTTYNPPESQNFCAPSQTFQTAAPLDTT